MGTLQEQSEDRTGTLAACYRNRFEVYAICEVQAHRCYRSTKLDLVPLIVRHGDVPICELRRRLKCAVCGRRSHRIQVVPEGLNLPRRELPPAALKRVTADAVALAAELS
jgi:hypothetical protein